MAMKSVFMQDRFSFSGYYIYVSGWKAICQSDSHCPKLLRSTWRLNSQKSCELL